MRLNGPLLLVCIAAGLLLSGCSEPAKQETPIVIDAASSIVIDEDETAAGNIVAPGSILGHVVDTAIRPLAGVTVRIPGMDLERTTDADGAFAFSSVPEGAVFLRAQHPDYRPADMETVVQANDVKQVRIIMVAEMREPVIAVEEHAGFASLIEPTGLASMCESCTFRSTLNEGAQAMVVEWSSTHEDGALFSPFYYWVADAQGHTVASGNGDSTGRFMIDQDVANLYPGFTLRLEPRASVPQTDIEFEVFVATFYNGADPEAWTIVGGSA